MKPAAYITLKLVNHNVNIENWLLTPKAITPSNYRGIEIQS